MKAYGNRVSAHGGHSGEFCGHAKDRLEAIVERYIELGFEWVGVTEHMPPLERRFIYPEENEMGLSPYDLWVRFGDYIAEGRRLQKRHADSIKLLVGMETEAYSGAEAVIKKAVSVFRPDYLVGSVHHVADGQIDGDAESYWALAQQLGGIEALYIRYFDRQYELINFIRPKVVGHFDLIRIFDSEYKDRFRIPLVWERIERNLTLIRDLKLMLDFNVRALFKGACEPYVSAPILSKALSMGIPVVPGDDSHGIDTVGLNIDKAIEILNNYGFSTPWPPPA
jgi:histidinol-phosphatase (PHP family)